MKSITSETIHPPLTSMQDIQSLAVELISGLRTRSSGSRAGFDLGITRAFYGEAATDLETFSRMLWAAAPLCKAGKLEGDWIARGLEQGINPESPAYWGRLGDMDSRMVEMAAIAFALKVAPEAVWTPLNAKSRQHLVHWLSQINSNHIATTNWLYFRVLVNEALYSLGEPFDAERMEQDLAGIESLYVDKGWYADGEAGTLDYYNAFAFHFYGLLYAKWAEKRDPERASRFRERASEFAKTFIYWWDTDGSSIPFGRSLVYRFGMAAFWSAAAYTELPVLPEGEIKGLLFRHLRWWFRQSILDEHHILQLGYTYPNQNMVEMYNAPGSPMWAFKSFSILLLEENHSFWSVEETSMRNLPLKPVVLPDGKKLAGRSAKGHAWLLNAGHNMPWQGRAFHDKYARLAYSSRFGFSVSVEHTDPAAMAPDSSLIVSPDGKTWFGRSETRDYTSGPDWVESSWSPCPGVDIRTRLTATKDGHRRQHRIRTDHSLELVEGGFAIPRPEEALEHLKQNPVENFSLKVDRGYAKLRNQSLVSSIQDCSETVQRTGEILTPWASTHLYFPATIIPVLRGHFEPGLHDLECSVYGDSKDDTWPEEP